MYGGKYYMDFIENLVLFPAVKKIWKSIKNWESYCYEFGVLLFWDTVYVTFKIHSSSLTRDCAT